MNKAEKFLLIIFLDAIMTYWAVRADLVASSIIPETAWCVEAMIAALLFIIWPNED